MTSFKTPLVALCISSLTLIGCARPATSSTDESAPAADPSVASAPSATRPIDSTLSAPVTKPTRATVPEAMALISTPPLPSSAPKTTTLTARAPSITPVNPTVKSAVKPILRSGADVNIAAAGFRTSEQFVAVARAARNLDIPFMPLKHDVLVRHMTLAQAIHSYKPRVNAPLEADRAVAEARAAIAEQRASRTHDEK